MAAGCSLLVTGYFATGCWLVAAGWLVTILRSQQELMVGHRQGVADAQRRAFQNEIINRYENTDKIRAMSDIAELDYQDLERDT